MAQGVHLGRPDQREAVQAVDPGRLQQLLTQRATELGGSVQWQQSYVTGDKIYCVYIAPNEELVREHATRGGFPANVVSQIVTVIDPITAEA